MNGRDIVVAIDQGGHATRAVAFDRNGRQCGAAFTAISTLRDAAGHVEHDGEELADSVRSSLDELARHVPPARWAAAGLAVQRSSIACWDRDSGESLAPVISWQDRRQAQWLAELGADGARVHALTGLPLSPHYGASKLRWCLDSLPRVQAALAAGRLAAGPLASYLLHRSLAERPVVADEANASRTQLWSPLERRWLPALLELFGVPEAVLPALRPTEHRHGTLVVRGEAVPLTVCTGDQSAVPFAAGPLDPAAAYVNIGTGAFVLRRLDPPVVVPPLLTSVLRSDAGEVDFVLEGTVNGAGSALEWFEEQEGLPAGRLLSGLETEPATPPPDAPWFLNGVSGLGSPFWVPAFESRFVGDGEPSARFRAVVESVGYLLAANLEAMGRHAAPPRRIVASGGLARSDFLCRLLATLAGVPVERFDDPEATARGLAFLAAGRPAGWPAPALARITPTGDPSVAARYREWRRLLEAALGA